MNPEAVKKILDSPIGKEMVRYMEEKVKELDSIKGIDMNDPTHAAIEMKARQRAAEKLREILTPFGLVTEKITSQNKNEYAM